MNADKLKLCEQWKKAKEEREACTARVKVLFGDLRRVVRLYDADQLQMVNGNRLLDTSGTSEEMVKLDTNIAAAILDALMKEESAKLLEKNADRELRSVGIRPETISADFFRMVE